MGRITTGSTVPPGRKTSTRRTLLAGVVAGLGSLMLPKTRSGLVRAAQVTDRRLVVPPWDSVPSCAPSRTDRANQGPFFIHNGERDDDVDMFRQDIRGRYNQDAEPGAEMHLHLRLLDAGSGECGTTPLAGLEVYVWHCDGQGFYSGFGEPGEQNPDEFYRNRPSRDALYNNARFCRGIGISDADGVVSFRSIFPGWYNGRDIHVHTMVLQRGSAARGRFTYRGGDHVFTTQLYFDPALSDSVHRSQQPYLRRTALPAYAGCILADERGNSGLRCKATFDGSLVTAQMQLVVDPRQSRV
jgi:protocatechuate 3,4-dioxygenase beta subunit